MQNNEFIDNCMVSHSNIPPSYNSSQLQIVDGSRFGLVAPYHSIPTLNGTRSKTPELNAGQRADRSLMQPAAYNTSSLLSNYLQ